MRRMRKDDAIKHFGTASAVALALGMTRQAVSAWPDVVPKGAAYQLQVITAGKLQVDQRMYEIKDGTRQ